MDGAGAAAAWAVGADLLQAVRRRVAARRRSVRGIGFSGGMSVVPREFDADLGMSGWFGEEREEAGSSRSSEWKCKKKGKGKGNSKCNSNSQYRDPSLRSG
jgi:hypothetical protein